MRSNLLNAFETTLTQEMGSTDLTAHVGTTSTLQTPAYLVIDPDVPARREYILFDGAFQQTSFSSTVLANRYLAGSAEESGIVHPIGAVVRAVAMSQHFDDLNTRVDETDDDVTTAQAAADAAQADIDAHEGHHPFAIGDIIPTARASAPAGRLMCDGAAVARTTYADLFAAIGTTYGAGDGSTTFNLPDLRGRFPLGKAASGTGSVLGSTGGTLDHVHTGPSHTHGAGTLAIPSHGDHSHSGPSHTHTNPSTSTTGTHAHTNPSTSPTGAHAHTNPSTSTTGNHHHSVDLTTSSTAHEHASFSGTTGTPNTIFPVAAGGNEAAHATHTHSGPSHTHGVSGAHNHAITGNWMPTQGDHAHTQGNTGSTGDHSHTQGNTGSTGDHSHTQGATGADGTGQTGVATLAHGAPTGATAAAGTGNTGAANPPFQAINYTIVYQA